MPSSLWQQIKSKPQFLCKGGNPTCLHQPEDAGTEKTELQREPGPACGFVFCKTAGTEEGSSANAACDAAGTRAAQGMLQAQRETSPDSKTPAMPSRGI